MSDPRTTSPPTPTNPGAKPASAGPARITLVEAIRAARDAVAEFTNLPVDAVSACTPREGSWLAEVDVIESPARLGDNDMLATYKVTIDPNGALAGFERIARYNRTDAAGGR